MNDLKSLEGEQQKEIREFYYSYSKLSDYARCGIYYLLKYVEKIPTPQTVTKLVGIVSHKSLEKFFTEKKVRNENPELEFLLGTFEEELERQLRDCNELLDDSNESISPDRARSLIIDPGTKALREFFERRAVIIDPWLVEQEFKTDITEYLKINGSNQENIKFYLYGYIDLLDRNLVLYDYKFKKRKPYSQNEAEKSHQLSIYARAVRDIMGVLPEKTVIENIVVDDRGANIYTHEYEKTEDDINRTFLRVARLINGIRKGVFLPADSSSWACSYCIYRTMNLCKEYA